MILRSFVIGMLCILTNTVKGESDFSMCTADQSPVMKLSIVSRRNETGQWIAQARLDHDADQSASDPWEIDIAHYTTKCGGAEKVTILSTMTSPITTSTSRQTRQDSSWQPCQTDGAQFRPVSKSPCKKDLTKNRRSDYELISRIGYYKLHTTPKTWFEALTTCEDEDAHLVVINSVEEANALVPLLSKHPKGLGGYKDNWLFGGFHDYFHEGKFYTILGDPLCDAGYDKWHSSQPNGALSESCGVIETSRAQLGDAPCNDRLYFICEQEL